jgi:hypothetical protein
MGGVMSRQTARRNKVLEGARMAIEAGDVPTFQVDADRRVVAGLPGLVFDGDGPSEIAKAARRAIAAELGVADSQVRVELTKDEPDVTSMTPPEVDGQLYGG